MNADISPDWRPDKQDARIIRQILEHEATPQAIQVFARHAWKLTDYAYWFTLGTLWVSYTGWSDLALWKRLFSSKRRNRETSIMKPSELEVLHALPNMVTLFRAHRPDEDDWIAYTISPIKAAEFALRRDVRVVHQYEVPKTEILALFLRRGEMEALVLDRTKPVLIQEIPVVTT